MKAVAFRREVASPAGGPAAVGAHRSHRDERWPSGTPWRSASPKRKSPHPDQSSSSLRQTVVLHNRSEQPAVRLAAAVSVVRVVAASDDSEMGIGAPVRTAIKNASISAF